MMCQTYVARGQGNVVFCEDGGSNCNGVPRVRTEEESAEELVAVRVTLVGGQHSRINV